MEGHSGGALDASCRYGPQLDIPPRLDKLPFALEQPIAVTCAAAVNAPARPCASCVVRQVRRLYDDEAGGTGSLEESRLCRMVDVLGAACMRIYPGLRRWWLGDGLPSRPGGGWKPSANMPIRIVPGSRTAGCLEAPLGFPEEVMAGTYPSCGHWRLVRGCRPLIRAYGARCCCC